MQETKNAQVDPVFYENYMLQISLTLDSATCTNLEAPNATLANAGQNQQVTFTVLPGADADLTVSCDTTQAALKRHSMRPPSPSRCQVLIRGTFLEGLTLAIRN